MENPIKQRRKGGFVGKKEPCNNSNNNLYINYYYNYTSHLETTIYGELRYDSP